MSTFKKFSVLLGLLLVMAMVLTACGGADEPTTAPETVEETAEETV